MKGKGKRVKGESRDGVIGLTCTLDGQVASAILENMEVLGYGE